MQLLAWSCTTIPTAQSLTICVQLQSPGSQMWLRPILHRPPGLYTTAYTKTRHISPPGRCTSSIVRVWIDACSTRPSESGNWHRIHHMQTPAPRAIDCATPPTGCRRCRCSTGEEEAAQSNSFERSRLSLPLVRETSHASRPKDGARTRRLRCAHLLSGSGAESRLASCNLLIIPIEFLRAPLTISHFRFP